MKMVDITMIKKNDASIRNLCALDLLTVDKIISSRRQVIKYTLIVPKINHQQKPK